MPCSTEIFALLFESKLLFKNLNHAVSSTALESAEDLKKLSFRAYKRIEKVVQNHLKRELFRYCRYCKPTSVFFTSRMAYERRQEGGQ